MRLFPRDGQTMASTVNREYSPSERAAFHLVLALVEEAYEQLGLLPQTHILGNNAHVSHPETGELVRGHDNEPNMLHAHIVARGVPNKEYIPGVPSICPPPGRIFDIGGKGGTPGNHEGNERVIRWEGDISLPPALSHPVAQRL